MKRCVLSPSARALLLAMATAASLPLAHAALQGQVDEPIDDYAVLTDNRVEVTNFNPEPISGLAFDSLGRLWAVNPYASTVVRYDGISSQPDLIVPTGLHPVSVAVWEPTELEQDWRLLVACSGTHALFVHDPVTGRPLGVLRLDAEPADLVVDPENGWAFVSCQGENTVLEVELASLTIADRYAVEVGERPVPLYLDRGDPEDAEDNRLYVAATVTGNNSIPNGIDPLVETVGSVTDLDLLTSSGLPDTDVYRIDPFADTVTAVIKGAGSLIFELDRNPSDGEMWVLSFDSNNKDPNIDSEPLLKGQLGINQLVRVPGVTATSSLITAPAGIDLDDWDVATGGAQYSATRSLNQARTLDFLSPSSGAGGYAFVAGPMSDVIGVLDPGGNRVIDMQLPAQAQCYDVEIWNINETLFAALCLGTMTIELFTWSPFSPTPIASLPLGLDPTPEQIRRGRDIFLDGQRSSDARFTCGSCHPDGMSDQLGWMLRDHPCDEKDLMVTQSLLSIADSFPHHWRGERDLDDFRKAFAGLLGDPTVPPLTDPSQDAAARDLIVFFQSLQAPPNPIQDFRRVINDAVTAGGAPNGDLGSAIAGQDAFRNIPNFNGNTCEECHQQQTGSDSAFIAEVGSFAPRVASLEVAHLRQLQHKGDATTITINGNPVLVNENGFGAAHNGGLASVFNFIFDIAAFDNLNDQEQVDTFLFIEQYDQGISPATAWAEWFTSATYAATWRRIESILIGGANQGWNDVVAFGRYDNGSGLVPMRWWLDPRQGLFLPEDPSFPTRSWAQFKADTQAGLGEHVVLGLPPEDGRRFGIDHDNDGHLNALEPTTSGTLSRWDPDFDGDGWPDGYEILHTDDPLVPQTTSSDQTPPQLLASSFDFATSRLAKYHIRTDEDVTYTVTYGAPGMPQRSFTREYFSRADTFVLTFDEPSPPNIPPTNLPPLPYTASILLTDRNGNQTGPINLPGFDAGEAAITNPVLHDHVADMQWMQQNRVGSSLDAQVKIKIDLNYIDTSLATPAWFAHPGVMVFSTICIEDTVNGGFVKSTSFTTSLATTFDILVGTSTIPYGFDPGPPWIVSNFTDAVGETTIDFVQPGMTAGQKLKVVVMGTAALPAGASAPPFQDLSLFAMQPLFREDSMVLELAGGF